MRSRVRSRGFALLLVLWTLVPVSALFLTLTGTARSDGQLAFNLRDAARLQAAADGGIATAVFALLRPLDRLPALRLGIGGASVAVTVTPLSGLVNPNVATAEVLEELFEAAGAAPARAVALAAAVVEWRTAGRRDRPGAAALAYRAAGLDYGPPGAPFETIGELRLVLGMTQTLFEAVRPALTLWTSGPPEPALAPPLVREALARRGQVASGSAPGFGDTFLVVAVANGTASRVVRQAVVRIEAGARPWRVLAWTTGPAPP